MRGGVGAGDHNRAYPSLKTRSPPPPG